MALAQKPPLASTPFGLGGLRSNQGDGCGAFHEPSIEVIGPKIAGFYINIT
jgi:hypothetical protein